MDSDFMGPVNIGSEEMVTIEQLVDIGAYVTIRRLVRTSLMVPLVFVDVTPTTILFVRNLVGIILKSLQTGMAKTMDWIWEQNPKSHGKKADPFPLKLLFD